ncbi:hypothetical protein [Nakamurella lactea]|uniref:hypothetical protein n=1 Tax=Nakamurella lactea TaxID=459515 RepID=UPI0012B523B4|nr:hypothetical protein [Nakamurella lactea]
MSIRSSGADWSIEESVDAPLITALYGRDALGIERQPTEPPLLSPPVPRSEEPSGPGMYRDTWTGLIRALLRGAGTPSLTGTQQAALVAFRPQADEWVVTGKQILRTHSLGRSRVTPGTILRDGLSGMVLPRAVAVRVDIVPSAQDWHSVLDQRVVITTAGLDSQDELRTAMGAVIQQIKNGGAGSWNR